MSQYFYLLQMIMTVSTRFPKSFTDVTCSHDYDFDKTWFLSTQVAMQPNLTTPHLPAVGNLRLFD